MFDYKPQTRQCPNYQQKQTATHIVSSKFSSAELSTIQLTKRNGTVMGQTHTNIAIFKIKETTVIRTIFNK
jgi:hypothetical protein